MLSVDDDDDDDVDDIDDDDDDDGNDGIRVRFNDIIIAFIITSQQLIRINM